MLPTGWTHPLPPSPSSDHCTQGCVYCPSQYTLLLLGIPFLGEQRSRNLLWRQEPQAFHRQVVSLFCLHLLRAHIGATVDIFSSGWKVPLSVLFSGHLPLPLPCGRGLSFPPLPMSLFCLSSGEKKVGKEQSREAVPGHAQL